MLGDAPVPLLVDLSPAPPIGESDLRAWGADQRVFISSVMTGMTAEREAAVAAIEAVGATPVWFEAFGGMDDDPGAAYLAHVGASDIYLGICGPRYGKPLRSGYSATHAEYNEAARRGLRISIWATTDPVDGPQHDFIDAIRAFHTSGSYATPDQLRDRVERRLREIAGEATAPWVKIGNSVVRALGVRDDGNEIIVTTQIRDNTIAASIEQRRPEHSYGRNSDTRITWPGATTNVRISGISVETTSSKTRTFTIVATRVAEQRDTLHEVSFEGRSPEELTELALRIALFGDPNPLGTMSFMAQVDNPLTGLEGLGLSEDSISEIATLLVTETLVGERGADHLTSFTLGPPHQGRRRLQLAWIPARRYVNIEPAERHVDGYVAWRTP